MNIVSPKDGDLVEITLSCGTVCVGYVEFWAVNDDNGITWSQIRSLKGTRKVALANYWIAAYSILTNKRDIIPPGTPKKILPDPEIDLSGELDMNLRTKKLVELRLMQAKEKQKEIDKHLKRMDVGGVKETEYGMPSFKKRSPK